MGRISDLAGSLVLSAVNALLLAVALLMGYSNASPWWGALMIWVLSPPLVLFSGAYFIRDLLEPHTRKQALLALMLFIPAAILDWYFRFRGV